MPEAEIPYVMILVVAFGMLSLATIFVYYKRTVYALGCLMLLNWHASFSINMIMGSVFTTFIWILSSVASVLTVITMIHMSITEKKEREFHSHVTLRKNDKKK